MGGWLAVALLLLVGFGEFLAEFLVVIYDVMHDLRDNGRGMYGKPSSKHVV